MSQLVRQDLSTIQPRTALEIHAAITAGIKAYRTTRLNALVHMVDHNIVQNEGGVGVVGPWLELLSYQATPGRGISSRRLAFLSLT